MTQPVKPHLTVSPVFRRTTSTSNTGTPQPSNDPRCAGWCSQFPTYWIDRLWGLSDIEDYESDDANQRVWYELRRAGERICEACPIRVECLSFALLTHQQLGLYGGAPLKVRRNLVRSNDDLRALLSSVDLTNLQLRSARVVAWLKLHPDAISEARSRESMSRKIRARRAREQPASESLF